MNTTDTAPKGLTCHPRIFTRADGTPPRKLRVKPKRVFSITSEQADGAVSVYEIAGYDAHDGAAEIVGGLVRFPSRPAALRAIREAGGILEAKT